MRVTSSPSCPPAPRAWRSSSRSTRTEACRLQTFPHAATISFHPTAAECTLAAMRFALSALGAVGRRCAADLGALGLVVVSVAACDLKKDAADAAPPPATATATAPV